MATEIKVPVLPESVADGTIAALHVSVGDSVAIDDNLVDIETEKVVLEVPSTVDGVLKEIRAEEGATVGEQDIIAIIEEGAAAAAPAPAAAEPKAAEPVANNEPESNADADKLSPAVRKLVAENDIDASTIKGTGKNGRILKEDVVKAIANKSAAPAASSATPTPQAAIGERNERRVPMTRLRSTIARRLKEAQDTQAMLTTFNDVNLQAVIDLRKQYKEQFEKVHGSRLGFMSFFVKAAIEALKRYPAVNASIDGMFYEMLIK